MVENGCALFQSWYQREFEDEDDGLLPGVDTLSRWLQKEKYIGGRVLRALQDHKDGKDRISLADADAQMVRTIVIDRLLHDVKKKQLWFGGKTVDDELSKCDVGGFFRRCLVNAMDEFEGDLKRWERHARQLNTMKELPLWMLVYVLVRGGLKHCVVWRSYELPDDGKSVLRWTDGWFGFRWWEMKAENWTGAWDTAVTVCCVTMYEMKDDWLGVNPIHIICSDGRVRVSKHVPVEISKMVRFMNCVHALLHVTGKPVEAEDNYLTRRYVSWIVGELDLLRRHIEWPKKDLWPGKCGAGLMRKVLEVRSTERHVYKTNDSESPTWIWCLKVEPDWPFVWGCEIKTGDGGRLYVLDHKHTTAPADYRAATPAMEVPQEQPNELMLLIQAHLQKFVNSGGHFP